MEDLQRISDNTAVSSFVGVYNSNITKIEDGVREIGERIDKLAGEIDNINENVKKLNSTVEFYTKQYSGVLDMLEKINGKLDENLG